MRSYAILSLGAVARLTQAAVFDVVAGAGNKFVFSPDTITAAVGDEIHVHYEPGPHSFEESTFSNPCVYMTGGVSSGTVSSNSGEASTMFVMQLNDTNTHWMFCGTPGHCGAGMALVVNPPASGNTLADYVKAASGLGGTGSNDVVGGFLTANVDKGPAVFGAPAGSSSSSSGSSSAATSTGTATAATTTTASSKTSTSAGAAATTSGGTSPGIYGGGGSSGNSGSNLAVVPLMLLAPVAAYFFS